MGVLSDLLEALDLEQTAADVDELSRLIETGEWRNDTRHALSLGLCVNGTLSLKAAELLGHDHDVNIAADCGGLYSRCCRLAEALGVQVERVAGGPIVNSLLLLLIQEIAKRLPELLDEWFSREAEKAENGG